MRSPFRGDTRGAHTWVTIRGSVLVRPNDLRRHSRWGCALLRKDHTSVTMTIKRLSAVLAASTAVLVLGTGSYAAGETRVNPQSNVPNLDAPGASQTITYPPDNRTGSNAFVRVEAPPNARIVSLDLNCVPGPCPTWVSADGRAAAGQVAGSYTFSRPIYVGVQAEEDAPLAGGTFSGRLYWDNTSSPVTVNINPGQQGTLAAFLAPNGGAGANVAFVMAGSSTAASGLQQNDVITAVAGRATPNPAAVTAELNGRRAGTQVPVTVVRNGQSVVLSITLDA